MYLPEIVRNLVAEIGFDLKSFIVQLKDIFRTPQLLASFSSLNFMSGQ